MQANNIDNDLKHLSDTQEGDVRGLGNAAVYEPNRIRAEALRDIDEGGFSCAAGLSLSLSLLRRLFTVTVLSSWFHLKLCFVAGTGFFTDA
jgi:hypothetical protein